MYVCMYVYVCMFVYMYVCGQIHINITNNIYAGIYKGLSCIIQRDKEICIDEQIYTWIHRYTQEQSYIRFQV